MKKSVLAAVAAITLASTGSASAATIFDFQLNGNLTNAAGGAVTLTNNGGVLGANGISFAANGGPTVSNIGGLDTYTLQMAFKLDQTSNYRKLVDFFDRTDDRGLYNLNGALYFYNVASGGAGIIEQDTQLNLTLTRNGGWLTGFVNGAEQFSFNDVGGLGVIGDTLHFFLDDSSVSGEASAGFVDYIRLADAGGFTVVTSPGAVPEPATWAMMLMGFFGLGGMLRARRGRQFGALQTAS